MLQIFSIATSLTMFLFRAIATSQDSFMSDIKGCNSFLLIRFPFSDSEEQCYSYKFHNNKWTEAILHRLWERIRLSSNFRHAFTKYYHINFCRLYFGSKIRRTCQICDEFNHEIVKQNSAETLQFFGTVLLESAIYFFSK